MAYLLNRLSRHSRRRLPLLFPCTASSRDMALVSSSSSGDTVVNIVSARRRNAENRDSIQIPISIYRWRLRQFGGISDASRRNIGFRCSPNIIPSAVFACMKQWKRGFRPAHELEEGWGEDLSIIAAKK